MPKMRAKMEVTGVEQYKNGEEVTGERLSFRAVCKSGGYDASGSDEDNTFAHFSPDAQLHITIANPVLFGQFKAGEKYYVDFTHKI